MAIAAIDTHQQVKELVEVGFTERQAEAQVKFLVKVVENNLVTKADLEKETKEIRNDLEKLALSFDSKLEKLAAQITSLSQTLTIRLGGLLVLALTAMEALSRLH